MFLLIKMCFEFIKKMGGWININAVLNVMAVFKTLFLLIEV